jgi:hypothetical protein
MTRVFEMNDLPVVAKPLRKSSVKSALRCLVALSLFAGAGKYALTQDSAHSQASPPPAAIAPSQADSRKTTDTPPSPSPASASADPRQAQIIADTQKLVKLSQELKAEVAKSDKNTLSLTVVKKAEEVEKLAKTLKEEIGKNH